jgi:hypothetical protein
MKNIWKTGRNRNSKNEGSKPFYDGSRMKEKVIFFLWVTKKGDEKQKKHKPFNYKKTTKNKNKNKNKK